MSTFAELLDAGQFVDGTVCTDCLYGVTYDQWPADWPSERTNTARSIMSTYRVTVGHQHAGTYSSCSHAGAPCEDDCNCERDPFSHNTCSVCGTAQAGERQDVTLVKHSDLTSP